MLQCLLCNAGYHYRVPCARNGILREALIHPAHGFGNPAVKGGFNELMSGHYRNVIAFCKAVYAIHLHSNLVAEFRALGAHKLHQRISIPFLLLRKPIGYFSYGFLTQRLIDIIVCCRLYELAVLLYNIFVEHKAIFG